MKVPKYFILIDGKIILSNSRNARKHLTENNASCVYVFANTEDAPLISMAKIHEDCILHGAVRGARA